MNTTDQLVSAVSHRINGLLQMSSGGEFLIDAALESNDLERIAAGWSTVKRSQNRIAQLVVNLNTYCHDFDPLVRELNLHGLLEAAADEVGSSYDRDRLKISNQTTPDFKIELDEYFCCRAIANVLTVGLMVSEHGDDSRDEVTLEAMLSEADLLIRVNFRHFDERFDLTQLMKPIAEIDKLKAGMGMVELLVSRKIVEGLGGSIAGTCKADGLNSIEIRFPLQATS